MNKRVCIVVAMLLATINVRLNAESLSLPYSETIIIQEDVQGGLYEIIGASTSSGKPAQTSTRKCSCKGGWYECPCSNVPTYGTTSYHECSNCGARHMRGSHSCKCKKCGGKGYI